MATQIIYNGTVIGTVTAGQSKILKCNGKKMKSDVEIRAGERTEIKYDGAVIATVEAGSYKTIKCAGKTMKSNIEIRVEDDTPGKDGVSPTVEMIDIEGGTRIIITDVNGPKSADIMDGKDGKGAYQYAQEGGYSGTEEEFYAKLAKENSEFDETDPTVPDWAKQPEKPKYTANEVGALPKDTKIPAKTSDISNDSGFITKTVSDLANYYLKSETLTKTEINALVSAIPKFAIQVVNSLPTTDISMTTVYLLKSGIESDLYTEYIYVNGNWEILGSQRVDLTNYALKAEIPTKLSQLTNDSEYITNAVSNLVNYYKKSEVYSKDDIDKKGYLTEQDISGKLDASKLPEAVNAALAQAKASGEFDGKNGSDGVGIKSVVQTTTSSLDGGSNVITVTKTDDTTSTFTVKNGSKGSKGDKGDTGAQGIQGIQGEKGADGAKGDKGDKGDTGAAGKDGSDGRDGADGKTPVKGVDYYTEADKSEFSEFIASELAKRGQLAPEYAESLEWLEANGDQSKMYVLPDGFIYAWMLTEKEVEGGGYTNVLSTAKGTDGTTIYGGDYNGDGVNDGYLTQRRLSSSGSDSSAGAPMCASGFISVKDGDIVRLKNIIGVQGSTAYIITYNLAGGTATKITHNTLPGGNNVDYITGTVGQAYMVWDSTTESYSIALNSTTFGTGFNAFRFSSGITSETIVTVNQEIKEGGTDVVITEGWASTGHAFVPANYEDRIINVEQRTLRHTAEIAELQKAVENGGMGDATETAALERIKVWDKPIYDSAPITLLGTERNKPALTTADKHIDSVYAKYRALMAEYPKHITEINIGKSTGSSTFTAVDMLRFDFKEPDGISDPDRPTVYETKPKIILMSGVHREWAGIYGLYYALEEIMTNPDFDDIRRNAHFIVIPCANPFVLSGIDTEGWVSTHVNPNGIAIHNNFGVDWKLRGNLGEYNYGGTEPYSELETQNIDAVMAENSDAIAFVTCHNNDYSVYYGSLNMWASSATHHMCNVAFRLMDKLTKAWLNKYGQTLKDAIDQYRTNLDADDYRLGRACLSTSAGTEQLNATKYGIQATNLEIPRMMKVFSGNTDCSSEVMTRGAEVYANFFRTILASYDHKDKKEYAPNLPWSE